LRLDVDGHWRSSTLCAEIAANHGDLEMRPPHAGPSRTGRPRLEFKHVVIVGWQTRS